MSIDMPLQPCIISDDIWAITTIWQEIRNGTYEDQIMVAEVIRDRTALKYNSDGTVAGTVLKPYQFSGWNTNDINRVLSACLKPDDHIVMSCAQAWKDANRLHTNFARGALLYHAVRMPLPIWAKEPTTIKVAQTDFHIFYKDMKVQK